MKILHTADNHLRDKQYGRASRGDDFFIAMLDLVRVAKLEGVDAIINCGDVFNTKRPSAHNFEQLRKINEALVAADIPMLTISGNHDKTEPPWFAQLGSAGQQSGIVCLDDSPVYVFTSKTGEQLNILQAGATQGAQLQVFLDSPAAAGSHDVLLWHGMVREFCGFPVKTAFELDQFPTGRFRAIMLGDIHTTEVLELHDGTPVAYPGSTELCSSGEEGEKFALVYAFGDERVPAIKKVALKSRRIIKLEVQRPEDLPAAVAVLKTAAEAGDQPIVVFKFATAVEGALKAAREVFGLDAGILRPDVITTAAERDLSAQEGLAALGEPAELISEFFAVGSPEYEVSVKLAARGEVDTDKIVEDFIAETLK